MTRDTVAPERPLPKTRKLTLSISPRLGEYLDWLAAHSILGINAESVAIFLLTRECDQQLNSGYPEKICAFERLVASEARR